MKNSDKPAYPLSELPPNTESVDDYDGLTKREYFAAMAMQGILSKHGLAPDGNLIGDEAMKSLAGISVTIADHLLKQLKQ